MQKIPKHIGIIIDGNRRWAKAKGLPAMMGHTEGAKKLKDVVRFSLDMGVQVVTVYALSTENLAKRSAEEVAHLFGLFKKLVENIVDFHTEKVCVRLIGNIDALPEDVSHALRLLEQETAGYNRMVLQIAVNYGGRDEIVRAVNAVVLSGKTVNEAEFSHMLDTKDAPDVDLIIRTGGHHRLSNFLPWQAVYAELYFADAYWPDFSEAEFQKALDFFAKQQRNKGK